MEAQGGGLGRQGQEVKRTLFIQEFRPERTEGENNLLEHKAENEFSGTKQELGKKPESQQASDEAGRAGPPI